MKRYFFNPNDYGTEYHVMALSKQDALESVKDYMKRMAEGEAGEVSSIYSEDYKNLWENSTVDDLPNQYTIDEFEMGQVSEGYNG